MSFLSYLAYVKLRVQHPHKWRQVLQWPDLNLQATPLSASIVANIQLVFFNTQWQSLCSYSLQRVHHYNRL